MKPRRAKWWRPTYSANRRTREGREAFSWTVADVWESECPVSAITQRSFELVQIVNQMQGVNKSTGSTVGADEMPGFLVDAIRVCQSESVACENAMDEANQ